MGTSNLSGNLKYNCYIKTPVDNLGPHVCSMNSLDTFPMPSTCPFSQIHLIDLAVPSKVISRAKFTLI